MRTLLRCVALIALLSMAACSKPRDYVAEQRASIELELGGGAKLIEQVNPPVGPFHLASRESIYFHCVARDGSDYYCEAYVSAWTLPLVALGGDDLLYRHRYYHRVLGVWMRTVK